jgi:hypothetical protein
VADPMVSKQWHVDAMIGMCGDTLPRSIRGNAGGAVRADASAKGR